MLFTQADSAASQPGRASPSASPAVLCGERGREILFEQSRTIDAAPEESNDYDVFVSYAHDEFAWVYENVFVPLKDARTADGRKLEIFFDTSLDPGRFGLAGQDQPGDRREPLHRAGLFRDVLQAAVLPVRDQARASQVDRCGRKLALRAAGHAREAVILATVDDIQAASVDDAPGCRGNHRRDLGGAGAEKTSARKLPPGRCDVTQAVLLRLISAATLFALAAAPAGAEVRRHEVTQISVLPGTTARRR